MSPVKVSTSASCDHGPIRTLFGTRSPIAAKQRMCEPEYGSNQPPCWKIGTSTFSGRWRNCCQYSSFTWCSHQSRQ